MIKISRLADYSVVILSVMSKYSDKMMSAAKVSEVSKLPEPTVSKILKLLAKAELVKSTRGVKGGYSLNRPPENITLEDIISSVDGPISITACATEKEPDCTLVDSCNLIGCWGGVNDALRSAFDSVTLADMMKMGTRSPVRRAQAGEEEVHGSH